MRARRTLAVGAALVAAWAVAGCSVHPGTAAVVDGREISPDDVTDATDQLTPIYGGGAPIDPRTMLTVLIQAPFFTAAADEAGVGVGAEEARASLDEMMEAADVAAPEWHDATVEVQRFVLALEALGSSDGGDVLATEALDAVRAADVDVNPRYGAWDEEAATVSPAVSGWVVPAESDAGLGQ